MSYRSHPSPSLLANYATGITPLAAAITVSAHLEFCAECRHRVSQIEDAEGRLIEVSRPARMAPDALQQLLARIEAPAPAETSLLTQDEVLSGIVLPKAVARAGLTPRRFLGPDLWAAPVRAAQRDGWRAFLLHAPAKMTIPTHGHLGGELIAVLRGAFHDGRRFEAGDFAENVAGSDHHLRVAADGPCVCLISMQGRVKWRGWARMITPLLGI